MKSRNTIIHFAHEKYERCYILSMKAEHVQTTKQMIHFVC